MTQDYRELTGREKRQIKKLVTSLCANYDKEYGCLPLDCECYMFGVCFTNSALCRKFRSDLLPRAFRKAANEPTVRTSVPQKHGVSKPQQECVSTEQRRNFELQCNEIAL